MFEVKGDLIKKCLVSSDTLPILCQQSSSENFSLQSVPSIFARFWWKHALTFHDFQSTLMCRETFLLPSLHQHAVVSPFRWRIFFYLKGRRKEGNRLACAPPSSTQSVDRCNGKTISQACSHTVRRHMLLLLLKSTLKSITKVSSFFFSIKFHLQNAVYPRDYTSL